MIEAALQDMFSCRELTHPVQLAGESTRGYFDEQAVPAQDEFGGRFVVERTFYIQTDSLSCLATNKRIQVGVLGAASVQAGDTRFSVREHKPVQDGLITALFLVPETGA